MKCALVIQLIYIITIAITVTMTVTVTATAICLPIINKLLNRRQTNNNDNNSSSSSSSNNSIYRYSCACKRSCLALNLNLAKRQFNGMESSRHIDTCQRHPNRQTDRRTVSQLSLMVGRKKFDVHIIILSFATNKSQILIY